MNNSKKLPLVMTALAMLTLTSCGDANNNGHGEIFDPNDYQTIVPTEEARDIVVQAIRKSETIDEIKNDITIENFKFSSITANTVTKEKETILVDGEMNYVVNSTGLTSKKPHDIRMSYDFDISRLNIKKPGINPEDKDEAILNDGKALAYVKDNNLYSDISNKNMYEFMPNLLYLFGEYETIDLAKAKADEIPQKFVDPTQLFERKNLPLGSHASQLSDEQIIDLFNSVVEVNNQTEKPFLKFKKNKTGMLMDVSLNGKAVYEIANYLVQHHEILKQFEQYVEAIQYINFNAMKFQYVFSRDKLITFEKMNIDVSGNTGPNEGETKETIHSYSAIYDMETYNYYKDVVVHYPSNLDVYPQYDLNLPNMNEIIEKVLQKIKKGFTK